MSKRILIVEDHPMWREDYESAFAEGFGAEVSSASTLEEAMELVRARRFDLYVTDGGYPKRTGGPEVKDACLGFIPQVRKVHPDARILVISATDELEERTRDLGVDFMSKAAYSIDKVVAKYADLKSS